MNGVGRCVSGVHVPSLDCLLRCMCSSVCVWVYVGVCVETHRTLRIYYVLLAADAVASRTCCLSSETSALTSSKASYLRHNDDTRRLVHMFKFCVKMFEHMNAHPHIVLFIISRTTLYMRPLILFLYPAMENYVNMYN